MSRGRSIALSGEHTGSRGVPTCACSSPKEATRRAAIKEPARVITTEKDLPADKSAAAAKPAPAKDDEATPAASATQPASAMHTDDNGRDERWWNARIGPLLRRLDDAARKLQIARRRVDEISADMSVAGSRARAATPTRLQTAVADVERRAAEVVKARRALEETEEETRKAGALPGWLRK